MIHEASMKSAFAVLAVFTACGCGTTSEESTSESAHAVSDPAKCCIAMFPPGRERGQCVSDARHGIGPCAPGAGDAGSTPDAEAPEAGVDGDDAVDADDGEDAPPALRSQSLR